jgi:hypothetical protein
MMDHGAPAFTFKTIVDPVRLPIQAKTKNTRLFDGTSISAGYKIMNPRFGRSSIADTAMLRREALTAA